MAGGKGNGKENGTKMEDGKKKIRYANFMTI